MGFALLGRDKGAGSANQTRVATNTRALYVGTLSTSLLEPTSSRLSLGFLNI